jgi:hypothetical protein
MASKRATFAVKLDERTTGATGGGAAVAAGTAARFGLEVGFDAYGTVVVTRLSNPSSSTPEVGDTVLTVDGVRVINPVQAADLLLNQAGPRVTVGLARVFEITAAPQALAPTAIAVATREHQPDDDDDQTSCA